MTEVEIYKHARENLVNIAQRQRTMLERNVNSDKAAIYRCQFFATKSKIDFLDKLLAVWEVKYDG